MRLIANNIRQRITKRWLSLVVGFLVIVLGTSLYLWLNQTTAASAATACETYGLTTAQLYGSEVSLETSYESDASGVANWIATRYGPSTAASPDSSGYLMTAGPYSSFAQMTPSTPVAVCYFSGYDFTFFSLPPSAAATPQGQQQLSGLQTLIVKVVGTTATVDSAGTSTMPWGPPPTQ